MFKGKKKVDLYSAFIVVPHTQGAQVRITQCYLQITPYLPLRCKHSPDGASPDWGCRHLIAAYYSLSTPKGWKAELADLQWTVCSQFSNNHQFSRIFQCVRQHWDQIGLARYLKCDKKFSCRRQAVQLCLSLKP